MYRPEKRIDDPLANPSFTPEVVEVPELVLLDVQRDHRSRLSHSESNSRLGLHASFFDCGKQGCMIAFSLIRIEFGKRGNGPVKDVPIT